jgi:hypothetical protein
MLDYGGIHFHFWHTGYWMKETANAEDEGDGRMIMEKC